MKRMLFSVSIILLCGIATGLAETDAVPDSDSLLMLSRILEHSESAPDVSSRSELIWSAPGDDNAVCIRSLPDVDGDGVPDVVTGHDLMQDNHNFFCYSGASETIGTVIWSLETSGGASGGYFWGDECIMPGSDSDGNGYANVLAGLAGGGRFAAAYDGLDGTMLWRFDTYNEAESGWVYSIRELGDVTGDSVPEVIFGCGSYNDHAYCIDGASTGTTPTVLWSLALPDASFSVAALPDVNADGYPDALITAGDTYGHHVYCVEGDSSGAANVLWTYDALSSVHSIDVISDINGNGSLDFVVATWGDGVRCGDGITGTEHWFNLLTGTYFMMVRPLTDVTGDGIDEVIVASWDNAIYCLNGSDGTLEWTAPTGTLNGGDVWTVSSIPDLNNDGYDDVLGGSFDTKMHCVSGLDGSPLFEYLTDNRVLSVYPGGDLNGDLVEDILAGTQDTVNSTVVLAISGADELPTPNATPTPPCIRHGDVTGDYEITSGDAQMAFSIALGMMVVPHPQWCAADCNGDDEVTAGDAQAIFIIVMGGGECYDSIPIPTPTPTLPPTETPTPSHTPTYTPTPWATGDLWWTGTAHVYDAASFQPIENAHFTASAISGDSCYTNVEGSCSVTVIAHDTGTVHVTVSASGYQTYSNYFPGTMGGSFDVLLNPL